MSSVSNFLDNYDWSYLLACVFWGLTTSLMLYVKLRKKSESLPVLILIAAFLVYMNAGELFGFSKLYAVACANRKLFAHQFMVCLVLGFMGNSYSNILGTLTVVGATIARPAWNQYGIYGLPIVGPLLSYRISKKPSKLILIGLSAQLVGVCLGGLLSVAMIDEKVQGLLVSIGQSSAHQSGGASLIVVATMIIGLLGGYMLKSKLFSKSVSSIELIKVFSGSLVIAACSRMIDIHAAPLAIVPALLLAMRVLNTPMNVLQCQTLAHLLAVIAGAVAVKVAMNDGQLFSEQTVEYVSKKAIAQELVFSAISGFIAKSNTFVLLTCVLVGTWLATVGADMPLLLSAVSIAQPAWSEGRLLARGIWQTVGWYFGSVVMTKFVDLSRIDFTPILSVTRTTDGKRVVDQK